ncbi:MAG TPA: DUF997 family protein [Pirellulales bacterium]|nr:DUF997 family protein [Pirellulales bacterium]
MPEDPIVRSSRREAVAAFAVWLTAMSYTVGYCYFYGYRDPAAIRLIGGVPDWVLYGVVAPWTVCTIVAGAFAYFISDADLGAELDESEGDLFAGDEAGNE